MHVVHSVGYRILLVLGRHILIAIVEGMPENGGGNSKVQNSIKKFLEDGLWGNCAF